VVVCGSLVVFDGGVGCFGLRVLFCGICRIFCFTGFEVIDCIIRVCGLSVLGVWVVFLLVLGWFGWFCDFVGFGAFAVCDGCVGFVGVLVLVVALY